MKQMKLSWRVKDNLLSCFVRRNRKKVALSFSFIALDSFRALFSFYLSELLQVKTLARDLQSVAHVDSLDSRPAVL